MYIKKSRLSVARVRSKLSEFQCLMTYLHVWIPLIKKKVKEIGLIERPDGLTLVFIYFLNMCTVNYVQIINRLNLLNLSVLLKINF